MDIELIAITIGVVFGGGMIVAKYVIGALIANKAATEKAAQAPLRPPPAAGQD